MQLHDIRNQPDRGRSWLIEHLKQVDHQSIWGLALKGAINNGRPWDDVIEGLRSQAIDCEEVMADIVGPEAVAVLLYI